MDFLDGTCLAFSQVPDSFGLHWKKVGASAPSGGQELEHAPKASAALAETLGKDFTREELQGCGVAELHPQAFIKAGKAYFQPSWQFNHSIVDYKQKSCDGIMHSGDVMDSNKQRGKHTMKVDLAAVTSQVLSAWALLRARDGCRGLKISPPHAHPTRAIHPHPPGVQVRWLFFALSSWAAPDLTAYPSPSLELKDGSSGAVLATYSSEKAAKRKAIVVCRVTRALDEIGGWSVEVMDELSDGNAYDYNEIVKTCVGNLRSEF